VHRCSRSAPAHARRGWAGSRAGASAGARAGNVTGHSVASEVFAVMIGSPNFCQRRRGTAVSPENSCHPVADTLQQVKARSAKATAAWLSRRKESYTYAGRVVTPRRGQSSRTRQCEAARVPRVCTLASRRPCSALQGNSCSMRPPPPAVRGALAALIQATSAVVLLACGAQCTGESEYWDALSAEDVLEEDLDHVWPNRYWEALHGHARCIPDYYGHCVPMELMSRICEFNRQADLGGWDSLGIEELRVHLDVEHGLRGENVTLSKVSPAERDEGWNMIAQPTAEEARMPCVRRARSLSRHFCRPGRAGRGWRSCTDLLRRTLTRRMVVTQGRRHHAVRDGGAVVSVRCALVRQG
jgi:hypothetical protein